MLTDDEIQSLISSPKRIENKDPAQGYRPQSRHRRCDLQLKSSIDDVKTFTVFVRQNIVFIENFSIGLRYQTGDPILGSITLVRYNGPHGESSRDPDGHYARSHIHCITAAEIASGNSQPQERHRTITDRYSTFEEGLRVFFSDLAVVNYADYFPELQQGRLFDGRQ